MSVLPVVSPANTVAEHVDHHNAIHVLYNDLAGGANATASPDATGSAAIAVGFNDSPVATGARAAGAYSIAVGGANIGNAGASASADDSIALGRGALAAHVNAIAIGQGTSTTAINQVNIGTKRMFAGTPNSVAADANLVNSQTTWWYDETVDILSYKAKNTAGTVKTGTALPARMGWHLTRVANQSVATATNTAISWDTEVQDTPANFTAPGTTLTIPTAGDGLWLITFQANMGAAVDFNVAHVQIVAGGMTFQSMDHDDVGNLQPELLSVTALVPLVATNTIVCNVRHQAAANQNYTGRITAYRVGF